MLGQKVLPPSQLASSIENNCKREGSCVRAEDGGVCVSDDGDGDGDGDGGEP